jgi:phosphoribosylaminoimidazolecarboxamide formyltransferase/IMP cyclohydrolase
MIPVRRALVSVHDKTGLVDLARTLAQLKIEVLSTGGTARALREAGVTVTPVSEVTGHPEIFEGRVKSLHPRIHGGLLMRRDVEADLREAEANGILPIDLVVVSLYPFESTATRPGATRAETIEEIDVGGPAMIRAAAKNHAHVAVVTDRADYPRVIEELETTGGVSRPTAAELALKAFRRTSDYDRAIADWLAGHLLQETP